MKDELEQLIAETISLTGAPPPAMLDADAPVLNDAAPEKYLVGLVGGKEVGKSSLINALVGRSISSATSFGPGTQQVIAYSHADMTDSMKELLASELPNRWQIVPHRMDELKQQVLLDLPDIDSRYAEHLQITRKMLRHMLYPLWIQSVEKYADLRPQQLLAAVADGNDPANFIFCLNKVDQISAVDAEELRSDFAKRVAMVTGMATPPRVYLLSAAHPDRFDLPELRQLLSKQKPAQVVEASRGLARKRKDRSLIRWIDRQRLPERAKRLEHLHRDAQEIAAARIAPLLLEQAIPRLIDDPAQRLAIMSPVIRTRLSRWPIVNSIDLLMSPILALVEMNLSNARSRRGDPDGYLDRAGSVSGAVQAAFAQVHQLHPELTEMYPDRRPWETTHAELATADLRNRVDQTLARQQAALAESTQSRLAILLAPIRWLLTIGALLWFPLVQPALSVFLQKNAWPAPIEMLRVAVDLISVSHLMESSVFLLIWFFGLWVLLRASSHRSVARILNTWRDAGMDEPLSLHHQAIQWIEQLSDPIRHRKERVDSLVQRVEAMRSDINGATSAESPIELEQSRA